MKSMADIRRENLSALVGQAGGQAAFADKIGKDKNQVYQWLLEPGSRYYRAISTRTARQIEAICGMTPNALDNDRKNIAVQASTNGATKPVAGDDTYPSHVRFPTLEGFAGTGRGDYVGDYPEVVEYIEVTREWASQKLRGVPPEWIRIITGRGDSMRGQYNDGDLVFIDSRVKSFCGDSAYCFRWNGIVQIKRLQLIGRGMVRILSENTAYPPIDTPLEELEIGGRAIASWSLVEF